MTVAVQTPYTASTANGVTTSFPFNFKSFDADDLEVTLDAVVVTTGFTVTGIGSETGGTVVFSVAPANGTAVLIASKVTPNRDTDYAQFGKIPSDVLDADFDRIWVAIQYLKQLITTAIKLPYNTAIDPILGDATARALKYVGFDAAGNVDLAAIPDLATTQAAQAAAEAAAATIAGFEYKGAWVTATIYAENNLVREAGTTYIALEDHTAGTFSTDLAAAKWSIFAQKGDAGAGAGDVVIANNLIEFSASAAAARANLGILAAALYAVGTLAGQIPLNSNIYGKHTIWIPAGAMRAQATAGPSSGSVETTTHKVMIGTLDFDYASRIEYAQFAVRMPKSWNAGVVQAQFVWSCAAGASAFGVMWGIQARSFADTEALDQAWGTAVTVTDTASSTGDLIRATGVTGDITPSGTLAKEEIVLFQVYRKFDDAADTLDKDARLHGVVLFYTNDAHNDA